MRRNILDENPDADFAVHVVWVPQLGASRGDIDPELFSDPRVTTYWDPAGVASEAVVGDGSAYDVYALYDGDAKLGWETTLATGRPVIADAEDLRARLLELLS
ncbi:MAG: hypothetical protein ICV67_04105 [Thermoleophilia bacterium]|nr:hypothetical protein [Thermoleophilia bacterium]